VSVPLCNTELKLITYDADIVKSGSNLFCNLRRVSEPMIAFKLTLSILSCNFERTNVDPNLFKLV
jgi:hypothetical protein